MSAYPVPSKEGTPFASPEWKGYMAFLNNEAEGDKPVRLAPM
jgi:hypothetical protein